LEEAAQEFVWQHPPATPCIAEYGEEFPRFLSTYLGGARVPYLCSFAELEWHLGQVAIAVDQPALALHAFSTVEINTLMDTSLMLQAGLRYLHASWPVDDLMKLYLTDTAPPEYRLAPTDVWLEVRGSRGESGDAHCHTAVARDDRGDPDVRLSTSMDRTPALGFDPGVPADPWTWRVVARLSHRAIGSEARTIANLKLGHQVRFLEERPPRSDNREGIMPRPIPLLRVDGPLMVFGGPYSNLEAMRAVLGEAARLEIPADRIFCTGDVVPYGADPAATVALVRGSVRHVVMGNCEQSIAAGFADCGCGFPAGSTCERLSAAWFAHATREL